MRFGIQLAVLALLVGVLAPTACVLWFMNVAIKNQRGADRQPLMEAYRGQLTLLRDRADAYWQNRAGTLERETREGTAAEIFERLVSRGRNGCCGRFEYRRLRRVSVCARLACTG